MVSLSLSLHFLSCFSHPLDDFKIMLKTGHIFAFKNNSHKRKNIFFANSLLSQCPSNIPQNSSKKFRNLKTSKNIIQQELCIPTEIRYTTSLCQLIYAAMFLLPLKKKKDSVQYPAILE